MDLERISRAVAGPFIKRWHYSQSVPTGKNIYFGWFKSALDLYAVADYGIGVNPYQASFLSRETGIQVDMAGLLELKRLCRREPCEDVYLSAFLSQCHKVLKSMGYKWIVSFSDPEYGHSGGVYRASNFAHLGKTNAEFHLVDESGQRFHRRYAHRHSERNGCTIEESRKALGVKRIQTAPKDRWFFAL